MKALTKTREFDVLIMGVSPYDDVLRIEIQNSNISDVFRTFTNTDETRKITHVMDDIKTPLRGYTKFQSIDQLKNGDIIVALARE